MTDSTMTRRRFIASSALAAGTALGATSLLSACGSDSSSTSGKATQLLIFVPGDPTPRWSNVLTAVNKKLQDDGTRLALKVQYISWANYGNTTLLKTTAGEKFDALLDAPWLHMTKFITDQALLPLDSYVDKNPHLKASIPQQEWDANKMHGKIYGIPQLTVVAGLQGFVIRKDLRLKHGVGDINSLDDLVNFLYTIKAKEPNMTPFGVDKGLMANNLPTILSKTAWAQQPASYLPVPGAPATATQDYTHPHVLRNHEDRAQRLEALQLIRKLNQDGILNKDMLSITGDDIHKLFQQGKFAVAVGQTDGLITSQYGAVMKNVPGAELEVVFPYTQKNPKPITDFVTWNFLCVNKNSQHPDKVIQLMDWLSIKENHDLLEYGIQGQDWKAVGDDRYQALSQYSFPGYAMSWRPGLERIPSDMLDSELHWYNFARDANNFTKSALTGFSFDPTSVKTQISNLSAATKEVTPQLNGGYIDPVQGLSQLDQAENQAGLPAVLDEVQKQIDAWLASKGKA